MPLDQLEYDHTHTNADANLAVRFYMDAVEDESKTAEEGRLIAVDMEMIEIRVRGAKNDVVQRPARPEDYKRFPGAYRAFKDNKDVAYEGTPLKMWPPVSKAMCLELEFLGFHTVEQLAEASDTVVGKYAGMQKYKQLARSFLASSKDVSVISKMQKTNDDLQNQLASVKQMNDKLMARIEALEAKD